MTQNNIKLKFDEFKNLSDEDKIKYVLHIYQEKEIFDGVKNEFLKNYGEHSKISQVIVDNYGLGDAPILILTLKKGFEKSSYLNTFWDSIFTKDMSRKVKNHTNLNRIQYSINKCESGGYVTPPPENNPNTRRGGFETHPYDKTYIT